MDPLALRVRIRAKLADGRLPQDARVRDWTAPRSPGRCEACDEPIAKREAVVQCVAAGRRYVLHLECMYIWYLERTPSLAPEAEDPDRRSPAPSLQNAPARVRALPSADRRTDDDQTGASSEPGSSSTGPESGPSARSA
jgi:hypothetical protein